MPKGGLVLSSIFDFSDPAIFWAAVPIAIALVGAVIAVLRRQKADKERVVEKLRQQQLDQAKAYLIGWITLLVGSGKAQNASASAAQANTYIRQLGGTLEIDPAAVIEAWQNNTLHHILGSIVSEISAHHPRLKPWMDAPRRAWLAAQQCADAELSSVFREIGVPSVELQASDLLERLNQATRHFESRLNS
jgi:hypothetical protein